MIETPFLNFLELKNRVPSDAEFRQLCVRRGVSYQHEARNLIHALRGAGIFGPRMDRAERELLAVLTRTGGFKPRLVVSNSCARTATA
jgi:hypothetical protein